MQSRNITYHISLIFLSPCRPICVQHAFWYISTDDARYSCTGLRAQLGDDQQHGLPAQELQHQQLELMPDASLAALQQQNTAELLASVAEYVQRMVQPVQPLRCLSEDSLAAAQQQQMVDMIREITRYLNEDLNVMKQTCKALTARQGQHAMVVTEFPCSRQESRITS